MRTTGIDVGNERDPSTIVDVQHEGPRYIVTRAEQLPLKMGYAAQGHYMVGRTVGSNIILIDVTGVGAGLAQMALHDVPNLWQITLVRGRGARKVPFQNKFTVGKDGLIVHMANTMEKGRMVLDCPLEEREAFTDQLRHYYASQTKLGHRRTGAKSGHHDDLIIGAALALWAPKVLELNGD